MLDELHVVHFPKYLNRK